MKYHYYLLFCGIGIVTPGLLCTIEIPDNTVLISKLCELVHERAYYLSRLEKSINLFRYLQKNKPEFCIACDFLGAFKKESSFKHPVITKTISTMDKSKSLEPLFDLWEQLRAYKMINDEPLIQEFTKLTLAISTQLALPCPYIQKKNNYYYHGEIILLHEGSNYTEAITKRNYYAQRITNAIDLLSRLKCKNQNLFGPCSISLKNGINNLFEKHINFTHKQINCCIEKIKITQSLRPLQDLTYEFKKYKFIQDEIFTKEFLILLFVTYKNIIIHNLTEQQLLEHKSTLETVAQLYGVIESLPLEEILDAIDMISEELPALLEQYEFNSDITWKKWLKKYWWVPPLVITKISLVLYLRYKLKDFTASIINKNNAAHPPEPEDAPPSDNNQEDPSDSSGQPGKLTESVAV